ncbi:MAG: GNAT family N-acetyltransferase [Allobranchiibius sp.]
MIDTDPFLVGDLPEGALAGAWHEGAAIAVRRIPPMRRGPSMLLLGPIEDLGPMVSRLLSAGALREMTGITVERHLLIQVQALLTDAGMPVGAGGDWDWMWTSEQPVSCEGEQRVVELDEVADLDAILALYALANPHAESQPGEGVTAAWLGVRDGTGLVAVGALHRTPAGYPHLTGIAVSPTARGSGWGTALSAALTRRALTMAPMSTLGMYADNDTARAVYDRLGYQVARAWSSRSFL